MKQKNIIRFILLPLLIIIAAASWYVYREYNRTHRDTAFIKPDFTLPATSLLTEFESNEKLGNKKYWDKILEIKGTVKEISQDEKGNYNLALGDTARLSAVRCSVDSIHSNQAAKVKKGELVTVKGICTGFNADELLGSDVILIRCVVKN